MLLIHLPTPMAWATLWARLRALIPPIQTKITKLPTYPITKSALCPDFKIPSGPCAPRLGPSSPHYPDQVSRGDISHKAQCPADLREYQRARLCFGSLARC